ncbi:hypothetical protein DERF_012159 [Dermatophagoides farinae]|uniref:Uncharacterized protein n=1 Tax=Dermatophagoides farinae TaxID=6954 RepID=A0A922L372_DERFA|nr:hypothetical protein DERF_012159 [Dermatophagoides farinae]
MQQTNKQRQQQQQQQQQQPINELIDHPPHQIFQVCYIDSVQLQCCKAAISLPVVRCGRCNSDGDGDGDDNVCTHMKTSHDDDDESKRLVECFIYSLNFTFQNQ